MPKKQKFYTVWKGKVPGIYNTWEDCKAQIERYQGAQFKSFLTRGEAEEAYNQSYFDYQVKKPNNASGLSAEELAFIGQPDYHSIAVDAASAGNPGKMEYQGVDTRSKKKLFYQGPFVEGTNNIGEFLALVHGLAYLKQRKSDRIIYSDSRIAIGWVRKKKCGTKLEKNDRNEKLFQLVERAENWLKNNQYQTPIVKWETKFWGEIPADFGRK